MSKFLTSARLQHSFAGKTVIVTGSSRGIGRAIALRFAAAEANIVLNGRDAGRLAHTLSMIRSNNPAVVAVRADVTVPGDCERLASEALDAFGRIDVIINNAGTSMRGRFEDLTPSVMESVIRSNVLGAALPVRAALPSLIAAKGNAVFISSLAGITGFPGVSIYSAAKMAVTGLAQAIEAELYGSGVHVGVVYPGFVENEPDKRILAADGSWIPSSRPGTLSRDDVAEAVFRCVVRRRRYVYMTGKGKFLALSSRLFPGIARAAVTRSGGRIHGVPASANRDRS